MSVAEPNTIGTSSISCMSYRSVMWNSHEPTPIDSRVRYSRRNLKIHEENCEILCSKNPKRSLLRSLISINNHGCSRGRFCFMQHQQSMQFSKGAHYCRSKSQFAVLLRKLGQHTKWGVRIRGNAEFIFSFNNHIYIRSVSSVYVFRERGCPKCNI